MTLTMEHLKRVTRELFEHEKVDLEEVRRMLLEYRSNPDEWTKYTSFVDGSYTRNLVEAGNKKYNILVLCWSPGIRSSIHDHTNAECFVKVLQGSFIERQYKIPDGGQQQPPSIIRQHSVNTNEVTHINDAIGLHSIENPNLSEPCISLHIYFPPFDYCNIFDPLCGTKTRIPLPYHSRYGNQLQCKWDDSSDENYKTAAARREDKVG